MPTVKGRAEVRAYMASIPEALETKMLRGAGRAAARVVADEAKERVISSEVRAAIKVSTKQEQAGQVIARVQVKGRGAYLAPWLEYGTSPHLIAPGDSGLSARALNKRAKNSGVLRQGVLRQEDSGLVRVGGYEYQVGPRRARTEDNVLRIKDKFVGGAVLHPGARPHPFLRVSLDLKAGEAIAAAQGYINARIAREGLGGPDVPEGDE
ncbi:HK97 gp10 family phage protein [Croceicoccus sp. BE223]|uniref:HK97 gp10 family phage protein n=1 Tax=Croceicoccus sp. BE223 TaxID=2817716 RepID=UPI00285523AB|nr:HK97 gp10 family phage protein [Croceicoccus sp. BE223]MDR7102990.1 hypothetical protein [Croceicoccus sp. BE223]